MSASADNLTAVGIAPLPAALIGDRLGVNVAGTGTASVGATALGGDLTVQTIVPASGQTAYRLPTHNSLRTVELYNVASTATSALIYPPTGGTINGGSVDASVSIAQNKGARFRYITPLQVVVILSA